MQACSSLIVDSLKVSAVLHASPVPSRTWIRNCNGTLLSGVVDEELVKSSIIRATAYQFVLSVVYFIEQGFYETKLELLEVAIHYQNL